MTDYCTSTQLKRYIGTAQAGDDALLAELVTRASRRVDEYCGRTFVQRTETRKYDAVRDVDGRVLLVDDDLLAITTLTNGDGEVIAATEYVLLPTNDTPKHAIRIRASASNTWTYTTDPEEAIEIAGTWGFALGTTAPDDIQHLTIRLAAWYYAQRKAPFEATRLPGLGQTIIPASIPPDIARGLDLYVRVRVGG